MREWWRGGVIYQVYPRSFQDSNGDGIGDLPGILRRLDHIASLGVDAIWLSPIFESPQADMGYDVSNYTDVDRIFGRLEDRLEQAAPPLRQSAAAGAIRGDGSGSPQTAAAPPIENPAQLSESPSLDHQPRPVFPESDAS